MTGIPSALCCHAAANLVQSRRIAPSRRPLHFTSFLRIQGGWLADEGMQHDVSDYTDTFRTPPLAITMTELILCLTSTVPLGSEFVNNVSTALSISFTHPVTTIRSSRLLPGEMSGQV